jgi:hypothetical protein
MNEQDFKTVLLSVLFTCCALGSGSLYAAEPAAEKKADPADKERQAILEEMRERVKAIRVASLVGDRASKELKLNPDPILSYNDQPRAILNATLWSWSDGGRPVAIIKLEKYRKDKAHPYEWLDNLTSFSTGLVRAEWQHGVTWQARRPALTLKTFPNGPKPAKFEAARLSQMKRLARRFKCSMYIPATKQRDEMRLLTTQLLRYSDADAGIIDGAMFGFASNGTNPDCLFVVELHETAEGKPSAKYGFAGMTQGELSAKLDGREVWTKEWTVKRGKQDTWIWFFGEDIEKLKVANQ